MRKLLLLLGITILISGTLIYNSANSCCTKVYANEYYYNDNLSSEGAAEYMIDSGNDITMVVNKEWGLTREYIPNNLMTPDVKFDFDEILEKRYMVQEAAQALEELFWEAQNAGIELVAVSGYRSFARQTELYNESLRTQGLEHTQEYLAQPGHSEHQTGLAMDVSCASMFMNLTEEFANTTEYKWLAENAESFGFIIRYPKGKEHITGYAYEPWHIRYVGKDLAAKLKDMDITLDEYFGKELNSIDKPMTEI